MVTTAVPRHPWHCLSVLGWSHPRARSSCKHLALRAVVCLSAPPSPSPATGETPRISSTSAVKQQFVYGVCQNKWDALKNTSDFPCHGAGNGSSGQDRRELLEDAGGGGTMPGGAWLAPRPAASLPPPGPVVWLCSFTPGVTAPVGGARGGEGGAAPTGASDWNQLWPPAWRRARRLTRLQHQKGGRARGLCGPVPISGAGSGPDAKECAKGRSGLSPQVPS